MRNVKRTISASAKDVIADLAPPPQWIEPELCKLVTGFLAGEGWEHEFRGKGFRMHARIVKGAAGRGSTGQQSIRTSRPRSAR
jgi:hypothetical protein